MSEARFRYIDAQGKEVTVVSPKALIAAMAESDIKPDTLVFDETDGKWREARELNAYELVQSTPRTTPLPQPSTTERPAKPSPPTVFGAFLTACIWAVAFVLTILTEDQLGEALSYAMGAAIGATCIYALLAALLVRIPALRSRKALTWGLVGGVFVLVALGQLSRAKAVRRGVVAAAVMTKQIATGEPLPAPGDFTDTTGVTFIIASYGRTSQELWAHFTTASDSSGQGWLAPAALVTQHGLEDAFDNLFRNRRALKELQNGLDDAISTARARLVRLAATNSEWSGVVSGFDRSSSATMGMVTEFVNTERRTLDVADSLLTLVQDSRPELSQDGTMLLFGSSQEVSRYNSLHAALQQLSVSEQAILARLKDSLASNAARADSLGRALGAR